METFMDGKWLHMGDAELFHIPSAVQQEPAIVVKAIGKKHNH